MIDQDRIALLLQQGGRRMVCDHCHRRFRARDLALVEEWEEKWLVRVDCAMCRAHSLFSARLQDDRLHISPLDLTPDEWPRFRDLPPITPDDVLRMTRIMRAYEGDLTEVLEDPLPDDEA